MTDVFQYKAFLSYSHKDKKAGEWLHKQLEKYHIPKSLALPEGINVDGRGIGRIFRDRDELPAAEDLTEAVRKALETSEYMIVLCSPNSAASRWVNKEIIEFKRLRGDRYVLPIIIDGEPFASDHGAPELECFPPAVRFKIAKTGGLSTLPAEPAAADARKDADGKQRAVLKILAGILGVGLDRLVEREMRRRQKRVTIITAGAMAAVLVMATLTYEAMTARDAANRSRAEAEDLVEFMLTDLREKLEPVGRLDVLDAVGQKVLSYHDNQLAFEDASDDDIGRRARAYHLLAEMEYRRGNMAEAQTMFEQANEATGELLKRDPNNTQRIFEHSQSVFWVGYMDFETGDFQEAEVAFKKYKNMADQLVMAEPDNVDWLIEQAYGNHNMGDLLLRGLNRPREAVPYIEEAVRLFQTSYVNRPNSSFLKRYVAVNYTSLVEAYRHIGHVKEVEHYISLERSTLDELGLLDADDLSTLERLMYWYSRNGSHQSAIGNVSEAIINHKMAIKYADQLLTVEPDNNVWSEDRMLSQLYLTLAYLKLGKYQEALDLLTMVVESNHPVLEEGKVTNRHQFDIRFLLHLVTFSLEEASVMSSLKSRSLDELFSSAVANTQQLKKTQRGRWVLAAIYELKIRNFVSVGDALEANNLCKDLWGEIDGNNYEQIPVLLQTLLNITRLVGDTVRANSIRQTLIERGYGQALVGVGSSAQNIH